MHGSLSKLGHTRLSNMSETIRGRALEDVRRESVERSICGKSQKDMGGTPWEGPRLTYLDVGGREKIGKYFTMWSGSILQFTKHRYTLMHL